MLFYVKNGFGLMVLSLVHQNSSFSIETDVSIDCFLETIDYRDQIWLILVTDGHDNRLIGSVNRLSGPNFRKMAKSERDNRLTAFGQLID